MSWNVEEHGLFVLCDSKCFTVVFIDTDQTEWGSTAAVYSF